MIARNDAITLLEGLNYLTNNTSAKSWNGTSRISFLGVLSEIFLTDDIEQIRTDLEIISSGQISSNTAPRDVLERALNQGITKENLEVKIQEQKSQVSYWINKIKERAASQKIAEAQIKNAENTSKIKKEAATQQQTKAQEKVAYQTKPKEVPVKEKTPIKEAVIPVTGGEEIERIIPEGDKLENIQIKFDSKEIGTVEERLAATQPFFAASLKVQQSEFVDLNPSFNFISKGISSDNLKNAATSLPEGSEKRSILRISYTMREIEKIFPNEVSQIKNFVSIENLEVQIAKADFRPSSNNMMLSSNVSSQGGYSVFDGSSGADTIAGLAKDQILDKASDTVLSKVKTTLGGKLANSALGKAVTSFGAKLSSTAIGKALSAFGGKIAAAIGSIGGPLGTLIGAIVGAIAGWLIEKLLPFIQKIKDGAKKAAQGAVTVAATIIFLPFILFVSSITVPLLITIIALPISVAIIMFIINSGAYVVPPKLSTLGTVGAISPYIDLTKTANPPGPFQNGNLPLEIEYTVEIKAKKSGLTNIRITDKCSVVAKSGSPSCPTANPNISEIKIPDTISVSSSFSFKYKRKFPSNFKDTLTIDVVSVTADVPEKANAEAATSAAVNIGNPPSQCPNNSWPIAGDGAIRYVTQGPFAPGCSHQSMRAEAIDIGGQGLTVIAVHSGMATVGVDDCYGKYVDIESTCGGTVFRSRYAHLGTVKINSGAVTLGTTLGTTDDTGSCSRGSHLHFDFRSPDNGRVNPPTMSIPYLKRNIPTGCCTVGTCN